MGTERDFAEHYGYLTDMSRMRAYEQAIPRVVREGDRVLDLASGTSILGMMALRHGAAHVTSVDRSPILEFARELVRHNGMEDRVTLVRGHSTRVDLPREFDLIISDQMGCFGYDYGLVEHYADARSRFLVEGGRLLPSLLHIHLAPVSSDRLYEKVRFWEDPLADFDISPGRAHAANIRHFLDLKPGDLCGTAEVLQTWNLATADTRPVRCSATMTIESETLLHGIGGWATTLLVDDIVLSCDPRDEVRMKRSNVFFPLERPVPVRAGDRVEAKFRIVPRQNVIAWDTTVLRGDDVLHKGRQSTFHGDILDPTQIQRLDRDFAAGLSRRAKAVAAGLDRLGSGATVGELRAFFAETYPDIVRDEDDLAAFVDEVVGLGLRE